MESSCSASCSSSAVGVSCHFSDVWPAQGRCAKSGSGRGAISVLSDTTLHVFEHVFDLRRDLAGVGSLWSAVGLSNLSDARTSRTDTEHLKWPPGRPVGRQGR